MSQTPAPFHSYIPSATRLPEMTLRALIETRPGLTV